MNTYLLVHRHPENYIGTADTAAAWKPGSSNSAPT